MRKFLILFFAVMLMISGTAQQRKITLKTAKKNGIVTSHNGNQIKISVSMADIGLETIVADNGNEYTSIITPNTSIQKTVGEPDLPAITQLIRLPLGATPTLKVRGFSDQNISLRSMNFKPLAPVPEVISQLDMVKSYKINEKSYAVDRFVNSDIATMELLGEFRGVQVARVTINPIDYNPVQDILCVHNDIDIEISYSSTNNDIPKHLASPYFDELYNHLFANKTVGNDYPNHPDLTKSPVRMLIVSHPMFKETLRPYIKWKTQKGFRVEEAYVGENGLERSASSIKSWVHNKYNSATAENPAPTFLVIVGDVDQVPQANTYTYEIPYFPNPATYPSDIDYVVMGNINSATSLNSATINFPAMYCGRLSAETTDELEAIIEKIIYYEKYQFADPSYLNKATLIAGADNSAHALYVEPPIKYLSSNYLTKENGFTNVYEFGVVDANNPLSTEGYDGCYDSERMGVGLITYKAHCDEYRWGSPELNSTTIQVANNKNKYPFVLANCCLSSNFAFKSGPCIGEYWLRQRNGGAVTYISSAPTAAFVADYYWTAGKLPRGATVNDFYNPTKENTTLGAYDALFVGDYVCAGAIMYVGNLAVSDVKYWTGYNVLGDPSLIPFIGEGKNMENVEYQEYVQVGVNNFTISGAPHKSIVAISKNGILLDTKQVGIDGKVNLTFDAENEPCTLDLVVTCPKYKPIITEITVNNINTTDVKPTENDDKKLFPNPFLDEVSISSSDKVLAVEIRNLQGQSLRYIVLEGRSVITLNDLKQGAYIFVLYTEKGICINKMFKK